MAVIYSYPVKSTPELTDKMLISDGTDNLTKQVTISGVKDTIDVVDSLAATLPIEVSASSGAVTVSSRAYAGAATTGYVPTGGSNTTFLRGDGTWVTPSGSGGAVGQVTAGSIIPSSAGSPLIVTPNTGNVVVTSARYAGGSNEGHVPLGGSGTTFLRGDGTWVTPTSSTNITLTTTGTSGASTWDGTTLNIPQYSGGGISFSGTTVNGIATYSSATQANVSSVFTVSGNKLSAPAGTLADPSIEVGAIGGLYAASGGITLAHNGANAIGVSTSSIVNYKLTQFNSGLKFGVSGSTLSTYTEATWTSGPTLTFSFGGAATLSASAGSYRVIGDMVFAQFQFTFSSGGYGTADLSLPVSGVAGTGSINFAKMNSSLSNSTVSTPVTGDILTNAASIRLQSFNYDQDSGSHVSGQLFELVATSGQPVFQSGDVVSGTIIYRKS